MAECQGGERRVGVAVDFSACGNKALKWAVENLVREGDHLILIVVLPEGDYEQGEMQLWETTGSRKLHPVLLFLPLKKTCENNSKETMKKFSSKFLGKIISL